MSKGFTIGGMVVLIICMAVMAVFGQTTQLQTENLRLAQEIQQIQNQAQDIVNNANQMILDKQLQIAKNQGKIELLQEQDNQENKEE